MSAQHERCRPVALSMTAVLPFLSPSSASAHPLPLGPRPLRHPPRPPTRPRPRRQHPLQPYRGPSASAAPAPPFPPRPRPQRHLSRMSPRGHIHGGYDLRGRCVNSPTATDPDIPPLTAPQPRAQRHPPGPSLVTTSVLRGNVYGGDDTAASACARPQRRTPFPLANRGLVRNDTPHGGPRARGRLADAAGAPLPFPKASREECPGFPDFAAAAPRGRPASGQRLCPQRKCPRGRPVAIRARRPPHRESRIIREGHIGGVICSFQGHCPHTSP